LELNGHALDTGDPVAVNEANELKLGVSQPPQVLFDRTETMATESIVYYTG